MNKLDVKEKAIFLGVTLGIFLPVRVIFYTYVSTWWVGSFGLITVILIFMLYLVKKEKLGYVGRVWKRQIMKISKGKLGIFTISSLIFSIIALSFIVYVTDINRNTEETETFVKQLAEQEGVIGLFDLYSTERLERLYGSSPDEIIDSFVFLLQHPKALGIMYAVIDEMTYGYHQHFNIVWLVEACESLCLVMYFRFFYGKKKQLIVNNEIEFWKTV